SSFEKELPAHLFTRIHKSYLVALSKIRFIEKNRVVIAGKDIPVGETYKTAFLQKINMPHDK
ncbi:MAG TPA: LytTR family DNA-binding domain-containing protein, partial [Ferruginibacter sp.]|nr:LytTR family DNA-binding domain-containing protein [Ferruginibacter sp.]